MEVGSTRQSVSRKNGIYTLEFVGLYGQTGQNGQNDILW